VLLVVKIFKDVNERTGYSHAAYLVSFGFFPILAEDSFSLFHSSATITYRLLTLLSWSLLRQNTLSQKNEWMIANPEKKNR
jgi:hypothetical protein